MKQKNLKQLIRKMYMPRLIIPVVLFIVLMVLMIINPFHSHISPQTVNDLSKINNLYEKGQDDISITVDTLYYSGIDYRVDNKIRAGIYYAFSDEYCYFFLICVDNPSEIPDILNNYDIKAHLTYNDTMYETIIASMSEKLEFSKESLRDMSSHIIINEYDYIYNPTTLAVFALRIFTIMVLVDIIFIILVFFNPQISIPFFKMRKYGKLKALYTQAEEEFNSSAICFDNKIYLTDSFLFGINAKHNVEIARLENIVWIYKEREFVVSHGNAQMLSSLCLVTDRKKLITIFRVPEDTLDIVIPKLLKKYPEIMYSGEK